MIRAETKPAGFVLGLAATAYVGVLVASCSDRTATEEWEANCVGNGSRLVIPLTDEQLKEMGD